MAFRRTGALAFGLITACAAPAIATTIAPATLAQQPTPQMQIAQASDRDQITRIVVQALRGGGTAHAEIFALRMVENYALAGWTYGETGGQALLVCGNGNWRIVELGGGAMTVADLRRLGVPTDAIAQQLLEE